MAFVEMGSPMIFRTHPFDQNLASCAVEKVKKNGSYHVPACTIGFWAFFPFEQHRTPSGFLLSEDKPSGEDLKVSLSARPKAVPKLLIWSI